MSDGRTNHVILENLPPCYSDGQELYSMLDPLGDLLEMVAVDATSIVVTFMRRSSPQNCVFCLDKQVVGNHTISVNYYYPKLDPRYAQDVRIQSLGKNIGDDCFLYDYRTFVPWPAQSSVAQSINAQSTSAQSSTITKMDLLSSASPSPYGATQQNSTNLGAISKTRKVKIGGKHCNILAQFSTPWVLPTPTTSDVEDCAICMSPLGERDTYDVYSDSARALVLNDCNHAFHQSCLETLLDTVKSPFLQCPTCKHVYGTRHGTMPKNGTISHSILAQSLPGYDNTRTIEIVLNFQSDFQGPEHPNPGKRYKVVGFPRKAYLPDTPLGEEALHGVYIAWRNRVLFTVGQSQTTGMHDCVTWNDIHLKTDLSVGSSHGYPDALHLNHLMEELKGFGITESCISSHMAKHPNLKEAGRL